MSIRKHDAFFVSELQYAITDGDIIIIIIIII